MRAWRLAGTTTPELEYAGDVAQPQPAAGEVLVRVLASGVTRSELSWYPTTHTKSGGERTLAIPGHEFAGTIAAIGENAPRQFAVGTEVFGMNDWFADGSAADFCNTRPEWLVRKPAKLSFTQAACVPIGALTAWQGLFNRAQLKAGENVLIHGGSGAVGVFAVQLARRRGAQVITTASGRHAEFLMQLGARQVIDYHTQRFEREVRGMDVVFDTVGGETLARSWEVLSPGGRMITIASSSGEGSDPRIKKAFFIVEPKQDQLQEIAGLLEKGDLKVFVDAAVPFPQTAAAYAGTLPRPQSLGKMVIAVAP